MKKTFLSSFSLLILLALFATPALRAQENPNPEKISIDEYKTDSIQPDFAKTFDTPDDKINFKKLRGYLQEKQNLQELIQMELANYTDINRNLELITLKSGQIDEAIKIATASETKDAAIDVYLPNCNINVYGSTKQTIPELRDLKSQLQTCALGEKKRQQEYETLKKNLRVVKADLACCQDQLDSTLAPEYHNQEFRKDISIGFAFLLGGLLIIFIVVILRSRKNVADYFFSDTGLQFITIFVLIIAIILFGILGILEGKELAAILAGISGYILGKTRTSPVQNPPPTNNPPPNPNPPAPVVTTTTSTTQSNTTTTKEPPTTT
jgi:hypothetical protein